MIINKGDTCNARLGKLNETSKGSGRQPEGSGRVWGPSADAEELQEVIELSVDVPADWVKEGMG